VVESTYLDCARSYLQIQLRNNVPEHAISLWSQLEGNTMLGQEQIPNFCVR
jgi:hypothetical protein